MAHTSRHRRVFLQMMMGVPLLSVPTLSRAQVAPTAGRGIVLDAASRAYRVYPDAQIQDALERAAKDPVNKTVFVHAGTYRPSTPGQALVWFNRRHDGIRLEAVGEVTLTAANPAIADRRAPSFPAVVNHVVYFGDGVSNRTVLRGFRITGANNFASGSGQRSPIESDDVRKTLYFYADGGGIKIYARSYPVIEYVEVVNNYASPCAGGVSVEHLGSMPEPAMFRNCIFRENRTQVTGAALDVLHGSWAAVENCLFVGNLANMGVDYVGMLSGGEIHPEHGSGALTVFQGSRATVSRSTFTGNWNGVDDIGVGSSYVDCIFWQNTLTGGISPGGRYELDVTDASGVRGTFIRGNINDRQGAINRATNTFDPPDPRFDAAFVPQAPPYAQVGYRPVPRKG
jgi:hypothetical protein